MSFSLGGEVAQTMPPCSQGIATRVDKYCGLTASHGWTGTALLATQGRQLPSLPATWDWRG